MAETRTEAGYIVQQGINAVTLPLNEITLNKLSSLRSYELSRFLQPQGPLVELPEDVNEIPIQHLHSELSKRFPDLGHISKTNPSLWRKITAVETIEDSYQLQSIHFSGSLVLSKLSSQLSFRLHPPTLGPSCRNHRQFGSHRFLRIKIRGASYQNEDGSLPLTTDGQIHDGPTRKNQNGHKVLEWLRRGVLLIGKTYRFLKFEKDVVVMISTEGSSLAETLNNIIPISLNSEMTVPKFISRLSLGFSKSVATLEFSPDQILGPIPDDTSPSGRIMTDGNALISREAMIQVAQLGGWDVGIHGISAVVQARLGPNKGTWTVSNQLSKGPHDVWIQFRNSQCKYLVPKGNLTLEVVKFSKVKIGTNLGSQMIRVFHDRFVASFETRKYSPSEAQRQADEIFMRFARDQITESMEEFLQLNENNPENVVSIRSRIEKYGNVTMNRIRRLTNQKSNPCSFGGFRTWENLNEMVDMEVDPPDVWDDVSVILSDPYDQGGLNDSAEDEDMEERLKDSFSQSETGAFRQSQDTMFDNSYSELLSLEERTLRMLDSGFHPKTNHYMAWMYGLLSTQLLTRALDNKLLIPLSASMFCIPDPCNPSVLPAGTIYFQSSKFFLQPDRTTLNHILKCKVVVSRSPCILPSDAQLVEAVDVEALRPYFDVAIFSTKGDIPLADMLGGGDYDGDTVQLFWDPLIVDNFCSVLPIPIAELEESKIFKKDIRTVRETIMPLLKTETEDESLVTVLSGMVCNPTYYQSYATIQKLWSCRASTSDKKARVAAYMYALTIDAAKQGNKLRPESYFEIQQLIKPPPRCEEIHTAEIAIANVRKERTETFKEELAVRFQDVDASSMYDEDLTLPFGTLFSRAIEIGSVETIDILTEFRDFIDEQCSLYSSGLVKLARTHSSKGVIDSGFFQSPNKKKRENQEKNSNYEKFERVTEKTFWEKAEQTIQNLKSRYPQSPLLIWVSNQDLKASLASRAYEASCTHFEKQWNHLLEDEVRDSRDREGADVLANPSERRRKFWRDHLFQLSPADKFGFVVAFEQLLAIKGQSRGARMVTKEVYDALKTNKMYTRGLSTG